MIAVSDLAVKVKLQEPLGRLTEQRVSLPDFNALQPFAKKVRSRSPEVPRIEGHLPQFKLLGRPSDSFFYRILIHSITWRRLDELPLRPVGVRNPVRALPLRDTFRRHPEEADEAPWLFPNRREQQRH